MIPGSKRITLTTSTQHERGHRIAFEISQDWHVACDGFSLIAALHFTLMPTTRKAKRKAPEDAAQTVVIPTVDEIVYDQARYVKLCEEQSVIFRQNVEEFTKEYTLYTQSADVAKSGQNWEPAACDRDAFVAEMKGCAR
ncbi:hypothetical protein APHAL10511_001540 [Amanita phalloides]|nr:hypothetical protein APHAL10511_001540 [Amanita phalloides]